MLVYVKPGFVHIWVVSIVNPQRNLSGNSIYITDNI